MNELRLDTKTIALMLMAWLLLYRRKQVSAAVRDLWKPEIIRGEGAA